MTKRDQQLCKAILSSGEVTGYQSWVKVTRAGSLLLLLPMQRDLALETLKLYQPQRWKGRCLRGLLSVMVRMGLHRALPQWQGQLGDRGLFSTLDTLAERGQIGFLLSSADSELRNLIGVYEIEREICVVKAGCGGAAELVRREYAAMERDLSGLGEGPACKGLFEIEDGVVYAAELIKGESPRSQEDERQVFSVLAQWLDSGERLKVSSLDCWNVLCGQLSDEEFEGIRALADKVVKVPLMHGDFTPWNIKMAAEGRVRILDWECSELRGMPGWDWLHYHLQWMLLVQEMEAAEVIKACMKLMTQPYFAGYLSKAGLAGEEKRLLKSYLFYSAYVMRLPREKLLKVLSQQNRP